jgi:hypothetical protein
MRERSSTVRFMQTNALTPQLDCCGSCVMCFGRHRLRATRLDGADPSGMRCAEPTAGNRMVPVIARGQSRAALPGKHDSALASVNAER